MPKTRVRNRTFDARPDRVDFRDRPYQPPLVSLPPQSPPAKDIERFLPDYAKSGLILDQGREGACTGFGMAAVINYLLWRRSPTDSERVSMRMLYHMARIYDEWDGEDYDGSSCRGAMKGWHRHGVTTDAIWPYRRPNGHVEFIGPSGGWEQDAAARPLGAYYRIGKNSIADMQSAIHEVGAIYCSADVHEGWFLDACEELPIMKIKKKAGGHAFALVGYNADGFIVQNSWGPDWGWHGFAVMTYSDWVRNGADAWVAVLGAPMRASVPRSRVSVALNAEPGDRAAWLRGTGRDAESFAYRNPKVPPFSEDRALRHAVVLGNDGRPLARLIHVQDAAAGIEEVCHHLPLEWFQRRNARERRRIAIYAHGGLNDEGASIRRTAIMAPYFLENGIYPLFVTWKTGLGESLGGMLSDAVANFFGDGDPRARGWLENARDQIAEARDRAIEVACENLLIKPIWAQMKQNAEAAAADDAGLGLLARHMSALAGTVPELEIHLVGHSAGSLVHGHLLGQFAEKKVRAKSLSLYAPACTVAFANQHFGNAVTAGVIGRNAIHLDVLTDERERADAVGPYGKSLLYLVSRALESAHKTPILGMEAALARAAEGDDQWSPGSRKSVDTWRAFAERVVRVRAHGRERAEVPTGRGSIPLAHGSFDNDIVVVGDTLKRIRGGARLATPVENLRDA